MVKYMILENLDKEFITRLCYFASAGGNLFVQTLNDTYGTENEDHNSQHTITLAENKKDMRELRDFLNSLDLGDKYKMVDKKICDACDSEVAFFKLIFKDYDGDAEYYCPDCMANVVREVPEDVKEITTLEAI